MAARSWSERSSTAFVYKEADPPPPPPGRTEPCRTATLRGMDLVREVNRLGGLIPAGYHVIRVSHWQLTHDWPTVQALITGAIARGLHERPARDPRSIVDSTQIRG